MRRILLFNLFIMMLASTKAQIAKWLIQPSYDSINFVRGADIILTDSSGVKSVWALDGRKLIATSNVLFPFREKKAVATKRDKSFIECIYTENGTKILVDTCNVAHSYPYYSEGKLLVRKDKYYMYIDEEGHFCKGLYLNAYPYFNGYAVCNTYLDFEKQKESFNFLLDKFGEKVVFSYNGTGFDSEDLDFVSSVNDENIGFVVLKHKIYIFDGENKTLSPLLPLNEADLKNQAKIENVIESSLTKTGDSVYVLSAKCGKTVDVSIVFDMMLRPVSSTIDGVERKYSFKKEQLWSYSSPIITMPKDNLIGLYLDNVEILPPQFDEIKTCIGRKALVKLNGKYGMLELYKDQGFKLKMNEGDDIAFRHQKFKTTIRVDMPTLVSAYDTSLEIDPKSGCDLDKTSKESKNTDNGNYIKYNCTLNIPSSLPDELTVIEYPLYIMYDGLKSSTIPFKVNAWHYKYFVVDVDDSQTTIDNGTVSFVFNINAERLSNEGVYPTTVSIDASSLQYELEKMSEIRYKCKVLALKEGINNIVVSVMERGCPPALFQFEVEYHKPVAKSRNKPAVKERVAIKKKPDTKKKITPFIIMD